MDAERIPKCDLIGDLHHRTMPRPAYRAECGSNSGYTRVARIGQYRGFTVDYCHQHNLVNPETADRARNFGIRVTLPATDTLRKVLGDDWERLHWYASETERDAAFDNMALRHGFYRKTDTPTQILEKVSR